MDPEAEKGKEPEILFTHLMEGTGLALDLKGGRMFITDFGGSVYSANLDGSDRRTLLVAEGNLTALHTRRCRPDIECTWVAPVL
jgi:hypothetical protein